MISELIKIANKLDAIGLTKEADYIDSIIRMAGKKDKDFISLKPSDEKARYIESKSDWELARPIYKAVIEQGVLPDYISKEFYQTWKKSDFKDILKAVDEHHDIKD